MPSTVQRCSTRTWLVSLSAPLFRLTVNDRTLLDSVIRARIIKPTGVIWMLTLKLSGENGVWRLVVECREAGHPRTELGDDTLCAGNFARSLFRRRELIQRRWTRTVSAMIMWVRWWSRRYPLVDTRLAWVTWPKTLVASNKMKSESSFLVSRYGKAPLFEFEL